MLAAAWLLALTPALAGQGAVATSEPHATEAAAGILAAGGNAVDAAIAASFALAVTYPRAGNLGGGGFLLYRDAEGRAWFLDFREVAPAAAHPDLYRDPAGEIDREASVYGWKAAGVPGSVPGMAAAHERWGSLPWEDLLAPAIALAEQGFPLSARESSRLARYADALLRDPLARRTFFDASGAALPAGATLRQPRLATTLRAIAARRDAAFREGEIVDALVAASEARGGIFTLEDFRDYRAELRPVQEIAWRDLTVLAPTAPSSGGVFLHQCLDALAPRPLAEWGYDDARTIQLLGEVEARAFADRNRWLGDPAGFDFDVDALVSADHLAPRRRIEPLAYTAPEGLDAQAWSESEDTTHYSVVDATGGACSVTTTLNGNYGAKVMAPGGFLLNNEMDDFAAAAGEANQFGLVQGRYNAVRAGRRPLSSMAPVIVVRDGAVDAVVGSPGGPTILTTVLQVLLHRYVFGMGPEEAVAAPRFHRQDRPPHVQHETRRLTPAARARLEAIGQPLRLRPTIGDVNAIFRVDGRWRAVADPRHHGLGLVVERVAAATAASGG